MAVTVLINGGTLDPQPRTADWEPNSVGGKLNGTEALGAYDTLILTTPATRGGTANFNWDTYENAVLTSVAIMPKGQSLLTGTATTYSAGAVSGPIAIRSRPGDIIETELKIRIVV